MGDPTSFVEGLLARLHGPMSFRFIMQPLMALIFAFLDGRKDARAGRPAYLWALFTDKEHRGELLRSGWKSVGKIFIIAIILDTVFQYIAFQNFRLSGALFAGVLLALVPYLVFRGPVNRLFRSKTRKSNP
jgi:hypothetical protein